MKLISLLLSAFLISININAQEQVSLNKISKEKVLVVAHRGDWRNYADNALEGIENCIKIGVDIVEIDLNRTKDGHLILMHDKTVDRTTNGIGLVEDFTLNEIRELYLRNGLGRVSGFKIPTLKEVMLACKGKIYINLDKADKYFDDVYEILFETETLDQVIIKSDKRYIELRSSYGENFDKMIFMPVVKINQDLDTAYLDSLLDMEFPFYEIVFEEANKDLLLYIKNKLESTQSIIWINSIWDSLCGGYSDDKALKNPDATWGYLINEFGARIIQTDRPLYLIEYLKCKGLHQ